MESNRVELCFLARMVVFYCLLMTVSPVKAQNEKLIEVHVRNASLEEFVKYMESVSEYSFIYGEDVRLRHPVSLDMTPIWADRTSPHYWNNLYYGLRNNIYYDPIFSRLGVAHNLDHPCSKIYRYSYKPEPVLLDAKSHDPFFPEELYVYQMMPCPP